MKEPSVEQKLVAETVDDRTKEFLKKQANELQNRFSTIVAGTLIGVGGSGVIAGVLIHAMHLPISLEIYPAALLGGGMLNVYRLTRSEIKEMGRGNLKVKQE